MPRDYSERLTPRQISLVVNFLSEQGVERVPEAIGQTPASIETVPTTLLSTPELTSPAGEEASASMVAVIFILTLSFTLLLVFWLVRRERNVSD